MSGLFDDFLKELGSVVELPGLAPNVRGVCLLRMKSSGLELLFELDDKLVPNTVLLSTKLLQFSEDEKEKIFDTCLKYNASIEETVSVKPDERIIYLHRRIHPQIGAEDLRVVLDNFQQTAQQLIECLA